MNTRRGRPRTSTRIFEDEYSSINTADFKKISGFRPDIRYEFLPDLLDPVVTHTVSYRWDDGKEFGVGLNITRPYFGGNRYWFVCPNCGRQARKLYTVAESHSVACRRCFGLVYDSQYRKGSRYAMFRLIHKWITESGWQH